MSWLRKIFRGSSHKVSEGQYNEKYGADRVQNRPSNYADVLRGTEDEDIDHAIALSLSEEEERKRKAPVIDSHLEEDEQLARALQESLNIESPPRENGRSNRPLPFIFTPQPRICAGCNIDIGRGRFLNCIDAVWHPECFRCHACNQPISDYEFSVDNDHPHHKSCYKELYHPKCDVCKQFIPTNIDGLIEYRAHPFWKQKYCPSHELDNTPRCCSCERMEGHHHMPETRDIEAAKDRGRESSHGHGNRAI
ncbi:Protein DA1-related 1 [Acorus gramineus]|uniref:Protein DA1-related 1 n=1 Tax=Acorus gramineus TaxID=55184 RepID=A0AAV9BJY4_ACOGR|nr:Protein DA1-related 1 [Acorus gramineus]